MDYLLDQYKIARLGPPNREARHEPPGGADRGVAASCGVGVERIRERSTGQQPPDKRLHV